MTIVQFSVLRNLQRQGALPLMQLADMLVMERTTLYRALAPLERHGWVSISDGEGRAKIATLTAPGARALAASTGAWEQAQRQLREALGIEDWHMLEGSLARLVTAARGLRA